MLCSDPRLVVRASLQEFDNDLRLLGPVHLDHLQPLPAVVTHLVAPRLVEVLPQEVQLHLPAAQERLLAVVQDRIQRVDVLVLARARAPLVRNDEEIVTLAITVGIV